MQAKSGFVGVKRKEVGGKYLGRGTQDMKGKIEQVNRL